jgi:hypothetical protein
LQALESVGDDSDALAAAAAAVLRVKRALAASTDSAQLSA